MKLYIRTFGCQQNVRDSEMAAGLLCAQGYVLTEDLTQADVIFINTCTVRDHAENKALSYIGRLKDLKKNNQQLRVIVCGCMPAQPEMAAKLREQFLQVDIIIRPDAIPKLPMMLQKSLRDNKRLVDIDEDYDWYEESPVVRGVSLKQRTDGDTVAELSGDKSEALVTIMRGCDNYCTFCIVPYVRGRERSRKAEDVIGEVQQAVADGYNRIMLLGQNVNAYRDGDVDFAVMLRRINTLDGDFTVRFMTSHPKDATMAMFQAIAECGKLEKSLHLPVQAGSTLVLTAMNRGYTRDEYLEKIQQLRALVPHIELTSDIIVGFPGETEEQFEETLSLVEAVRFNSLFTFMFSPRKGTPAADMENMIPTDVKKARFMRLLDVQKKVEESFDDTQ